MVWLVLEVIGSLVLLYIALLLLGGILSADNSLPPPGPPEPPAPRAPWRWYEVAGLLYWAGVIVAALVAGLRA